MADPVSLAITIGLNLATMALTAMQKINGPRLMDLTVTVADYGTPLFYLEGDRRLELAVFYAEPITESRRRTKSKGGKYKEYIYSGTFACVGADQEIASWIKVWLDRRLAYDATGTVAIDSHDASQYMRFYLGTEDQDPDPRMVAYVESLEGPDTCPAYLGVAYVMFENLPLEPFGNRFPQVSGEIATAGNPAYPSEIIDTDFAGGTYFFSGDYDQLLAGGGAGIAIINNRTLELEGDISLDLTGVDARVAGWEAGSFLGVTEGDDHLYRFDFFGNGTAVHEHAIRALSTAVDSNGNWHWGARNNSTGSDIIIDGIETYRDDVERMVIFFDRDDNLWVLFREISTGDVVFAQCSLGLQTITEQFTVPEADGITLSETGAYHYRDGAADHFIFADGDAIWAVDPNDGTVLYSYTGAFGDPLFTTISPDATSLWAGYYKISMADLTLIETFDPAPYGLGGAFSNPTSRTAFDPVNNALFRVAGDGPTYLFLDRFDPGTTTLEAICNRAAAGGGLTPDEYDFSAFTQELTGYSWTQGSGKDIVEHLLELYDCDVRMNGFVLEGLLRGGAVEGSVIPKEMFVRTDSDRAAYELTVASESDLPRRIFATYADHEADQQPNTVISQRAGVSVLTAREMSFDLNTLALTPDQAQPLVDRALRRQYMGAVKGTLKLPPHYLAILPGDVKDFGVEDDLTIRARVVRTVISPNRTLTITLERDRASVADLRSAPGGAASGRPPQTTFNSVETVLFILDVPLLTDAHDQTTPYLYVGGAPAEDGDWPGTDVLRSLSGSTDTYDAGWDSVAPSEAANWGFVTTQIPSTPATVIDNGTEIIVNSPQGTFTSATDEELIEDASVNQIVVGNIGRWEVMQFRDAELIAEDQWLFSGLIRGQRGTERFIDTHQLGDYFILTAGSFHKHDMGADKIDDTDWYKAITYGRLSTSRPPLEIEFESEALRPLSPVHLTITRDPISGDFDITFIRRSRIGGASLDGHDIPLGETSEAYVLRILDGSNGAVRTEDLIDESYHYDSYQQVEDFGGVQPFITVSVAQKSPSLGLEGEAAVATG